MLSFFSNIKNNYYGAKKNSQKTSLSDFALLLKKKVYRKISHSSMNEYKNAKPPPSLLPPPPAPPPLQGGSTQLFSNHTSLW